MSEPEIARFYLYDGRGKAVYWLTELGNVYFGNRDYGGFVRSNGLSFRDANDRTKISLLDIINNKIIFTDSDGLKYELVMKAI